MNCLQEISTVLLETLNNNIPEISWREQIGAVQNPQEAAGTFACDNISFSHANKCSTKCIVAYNLYITNPVVDQQGISYIENLAVKTRIALVDNSSMSGQATGGAVKSIVFSTLPSQNEMGLATIKYEIYLDIEEE